MGESQQAVDRQVARVGVLTAAVGLLFLVEYAEGGYDRWDVMVALVFGGFGVWWVFAAGFIGAWEPALVGLLVAGAAVVILQAIGVEWLADDKGWWGFGLIVGSSLLAGVLQRLAARRG